MINTKRELQELNYRIAKLSDSRRHLSKEIKSLDKTILECLERSSELLSLDEKGFCDE